MAQVVALGEIGRDCVATDQLPLSRVCHCVTATIATLASHPDAAELIMTTPDDTTLSSLLLLVEVGARARTCMCARVGGGGCVRVHCVPLCRRCATRPTLLRAAPAASRLLRHRYLKACSSHAHAQCSYTLALNPSKGCIEEQQASCSSPPACTHAHTRMHVNACVHTGV